MTRSIVEQSADELYKHLPEELNLDIVSTYKPLFAAMKELHLSPVVYAKTFEQRIKHLPVLKAMLATAQSASNVSIAYDDGDYFGAMFVDSEVMRDKYRPPENANFMVRYLNKFQPETGFKPDLMYTIFYDEQLHEIHRSSGEKSAYDPRQRSWYKRLKDKKAGEVIRTKPYVFYDSKVVGLSLSEKSENGTIIAFDITLENIAKKLSSYRNEEGSDVVLLNNEGNVVAYDNQHEIVTIHEQSTNAVHMQLARLDQLDSDVLSHVNEIFEIKKLKEQFEYNGDDWIVSIQKIRKGGVAGNESLYALMITPISQLLKDAVHTRQILMLLALMVLIICIPVIWLVSKKISTPLILLSKDTEAISNFNFERSQLKASFITEVDELAIATESMKSTIVKFTTLINSLAGEKNLEKLKKSITRETMSISHADAAVMHLKDSREDNYACTKDTGEISLKDIPHLSFEEIDNLFEKKNSKSIVLELTAGKTSVLSPLLGLLGEKNLCCIIVPLQDRNNENIGLLTLVYKQSNSARKLSNIEFIEALSGFAAVTLETKQSLEKIKRLLDGFISSISDAIDAKSRYTSGHCNRVPKLTMMIARAAVNSHDGKYKDFFLSPDEEEELRLAGELHDCGKITTPVYVVDKATKLETIYDRIHEIRTRFEVLKRDAEIECWKNIAEGGDKKKLLKILQEKHAVLDDDFSFIATCNVGGEFMADDKIERLQQLSDKTWMRTLDDTLGLSWVELQRKGKDKNSLPVEEKLLADKTEHLIPWEDSYKKPEDLNLGFNVDVPEYKYNRGELYNLSVKKGTLSAEERYMINDHMVQTIVMLNKLDYPEKLSNIPLLAGSHHETMDGKGYPKKLVMAEQPVTARMMVIADIYEALTADDRPYKKAKTLSESLRILSFMRNDKHIDADLFDLFLSSGVYLEYANEFLSDDQIDEINIEDYMSK